MKKITLALSVAAVLLAAACNNKPDFNYFYYEPEEYALISQYLNLPERPDKYEVTFPEHLSREGLFPRAVNPDKAILGRVLFYDKKLSKDGTVSCASCHKQELAFSDNEALSKGVQERRTARNSIALGSVANFSAYYGTDLNGAGAIRFFWDNRAETVAQQSTGSLTNPKEMDMHMSEVVDAVKAQPFYVPLFKKAYGDDIVSENRVTEAISNFVNAMGSYQSKFDVEASKAVSNSGSYYVQSVMEQDFSAFTPQENRGKDLYEQNCAGCHSGNIGRPMLYNANNGLDLVTTDDEGVGGITGNAEEKGTFKVPTLRNIALTAPYMHDGRFKTLDEVLEHYSHGIQNHPNLNALLKNGDQPKQMNFSDSDKQSLIAFLNTLTDNHLLTDAQFSDPFKH